MWELEGRKKIWNCIPYDASYARQEIKKNGDVTPAELKEMFENLTGTSQEQANLGGRIYSALLLKNS